MQFQVPQFIDTEDKIVGPLTLKQFGYIAVAAILSFALFFFMKPLAWFFLAIPILGGGASFAFVKVGGRPLSAVTVAAFRYFWEPQQYVWKTEEPKRSKTKDLAPKEGVSLEKIIGGFALKSAWQAVQTGSKAPEHIAPPKEANERYQIFRGLTGEKRAARRVDYR